MKNTFLIRLWFTGGLLTMLWILQPSIGLLLYIFRWWYFFRSRILYVKLFEYIKPVKTLENLSKLWGARKIVTKCVEPANKSHMLNYIAIFHYVNIFPFSQIMTNLNSISLRRIFASKKYFCRPILFYVLQYNLKHKRVYQGCVASLGAIPGTITWF